MSEKLSIEQLRREHCYLVLSVKQQRMVEVYLETGDKLKAVLAAFKCVNPKVARVMTYHYFQKPNVVACLAVAAGGDAEREQFDMALARAIKNPKTTRNQISALRLFAETHGYTMAEPAESETEQQTFAIGSVIVQDGQKYRVVAEEIE